MQSEPMCVPSNWPYVCHQMLVETSVSAALYMVFLFFS